MGAFGATTTAIAITSIAFSVTGINDKINKAASKVFGADLVGFANLAGMAYGAFNGGFGGGAAASGAVEGLDAMSTGAAGDWYAGAAGAEAMAGSAVDLASGAADSYNLMDQAPNLFQSQASNPFNDLTASTESFAVSGQPAPVSATSATTSSIADKQFVDAAAKSGAPASAPATSTDASALKADAASTDKAAASKAGGDVKAPKSVMDRIMGMVTDKDGGISKQAMELGGSALKGAAGAYSASAARRQAQEQFDAEWNRRERNAGAVGWKQPA